MKNGNPIWKKYSMSNGDLFIVVVLGVFGTGYLIIRLILWNFKRHLNNYVRQKETEQKKESAH